jgi:hypothetical protein
MTQGPNTPPSSWYDEPEENNEHDDADYWADQYIKAKKEDPEVFERGL